MIMQAWVRLLQKSSCVVIQAVMTLFRYREVRAYSAITQPYDHLLQSSIPWWSIAFGVHTLH